MTVLTMRRVREHFVVTGPDIEPMTFKTRREARDWCYAHFLWFANSRGYSLAARKKGAPPKAHKG